MAPGIKITKIGDSAAVILPKALLAKWGVSVGDTLHVCETSDGIGIFAHDPEFTGQMSLVDQIMREDRDILQHLAR